jgi:hypothetical protein
MNQPPPPGQPPYPPAGGYGGQGPGGYPPHGGYPPPYGPGGYAPPPPPPKRRPIPIQQRGVIQERSPVIAALLSAITCGVYALIWLYSSGKELKEALGDEEIKPGIDVLLAIVTCGLWSIYAMYRNAQKIHAALLTVDPYAKDQSELTLILNLASLFTAYITWVVAIYVVQEELNKLARA